MEEWGDLMGTMWHPTGYSKINVGAPIRHTSVQHFRFSFNWDKGAKLGPCPRAITAVAVKLHTQDTLQTDWPVISNSIQKVYNMN